MLALKIRTATLPKPGALAAAIFDPVMVLVIMISSQPSDLAKSFQDRIIFAARAPSFFRAFDRAGRLTRFHTRPCRCCS
ncbi:protein of unknown function [Magnetospirillum sp. XM-1]|nr:protein of unknown function [Magnetospirillum sp. XM-1]